MAVAYTTDEAIQRVRRGDINVSGATVVIDNLTNDVRGTRVRAAISPQELVRQVDRLRGSLFEMGAAAAVVCQLKPMQITDVTPYNDHLDAYLRAQGKGGFGCRTQIRLSDLKRDGYHVQPQFDSVIDRTYACALRGFPVPRPTPLNEFIPDNLRRRWEVEWPRVGGVQGQATNVNHHGWKW